MAVSTALKQELESTNSVAEFRLYAHSPLLYWWPVWAIGLAMALWTYLDHQHMALVPDETVLEGNRLIAPEGSELAPPTVYMSPSRIPGAVFVVTLLLVSVLGNVWLRGPWAMFAAACLVAGILLVSYLEAWDPLLRWLRLLHIHINLGGYLVISVVLLVAWVLTVFVFDRWTYMIFSAGQIRIRSEIGDAETAFDASSVTFEKKPYDYFRWLVGLGAGDLILRAGGPNGRIFELPNVVHVGRRLHLLEERLRIRDVV
jgi:hypothetical protein